MEAGPTAPGITELWRFGYQFHPVRLPGFTHCSLLPTNIFTLG